MKWTRCLTRGPLSRCRCLKKKPEPLFHVPVIWLYVFVSISWLTLCNPTNCSLQGYSVHGIFQARILECVAISYSRWSSWPRDRILLSYILCIGRWILYHCTIWEVSNPFLVALFKKQVILAFIEMSCTFVCIVIPAFKELLVKWGC